MPESDGFALELDHVTVFTSMAAPEAQTLEALGLRGFGGTTRHGNLGTASTSFFFQNTYLELFWADDAKLVERNLTPIGIDVPARMNWRETGDSPFGLALRRRAGVTGPLPFSNQPLVADWMPAGTILEMSGEHTAEPYYAVIPPVLAFPAFKANLPEPNHPLGVQTLTGVSLTVVRTELSPTARLLSGVGLVAFETGMAPIMMLTFDGGAQGLTFDVRPTLPVVLNV
ncbi:MAG: hypothetical protein ACRDH2_01370 [Anaerolineales bacterium]